MQRTKPSRSTHDGKRRSRLLLDALRELVERRCYLRTFPRQWRQLEKACWRGEMEIAKLLKGIGEGCTSYAQTALCRDLSVAVDQVIEVARNGPWPSDAEWPGDPWLRECNALVTNLDYQRKIEAARDAR